MLRIPIQHALPGMVLAVPAFHPHRPGVVLLNSGVRLTDKSIGHLQKLKMPTLWIDHPVSRMVNRFVRVGVVQAYEELRGNTDRILNSVTSDPHARWTTRSETESLIQRLVLELVSQRESQTSYIDCPPNPDLSPRVAHAASTCFLSALLSMQLHGYILRQRRKASVTPQVEMANLCLGALLHDVGLTEISQDAYEKWIETGSEDDPRWQEHAQKGYELLTGRIDSAAATAILLHHRYFNGTGFPIKTDWDGKTNRSGGNDVHVFARIITAADQFDELKHQPDGTVWPTVRALRWFLMDTTWARMDPNVARAILSIVPAYSPGSMVKLSSGDQAFVVDWKPGNPCRPTVAVVNDFANLVPSKHAETSYEKSAVVGARREASEPAGGRIGMQDPAARLPDDPDHHSDELPGLLDDSPIRTIDLARTPGLQIVEAEGEPVAEDNFTLPHDLRPASRTGTQYGELDAA